MACPIEEPVMVNTRRVERRPFAIAPQVTVHVLQQHIDEAAPNCPSKCAIALALKSMGFLNPRVGLKGDGSLSFEKFNKRTKKAERWMYRGLPQTAVKFTYDFDNRKVTKPFHFVLDFGRKHHIVPWVRVRYAGGERRGPRLAPRSDKGESGRTTRREKLQQALSA